MKRLIPWLLGLLWLTPVHADYHVTRDGLDTNPGTLEKPFATVGRALRSLRPGDTLFIHEGRYAAVDGNRLDLLRSQGTDVSPITITRWRDGQVTLDGSIPVSTDGWSRVTEDDALYAHLRDGAKWRLNLCADGIATGRRELLPDSALTERQAEQVDAYIRTHFSDILDCVYKKPLDRDVWQLFLATDAGQLRSLTVARFPNARVWSELMWDRDLSMRWVSDQSGPGRLVDHPTRGSLAKLAGQKVSFDGCVVTANFEACFSKSGHITRHKAGENAFDYVIPGSERKTVRHPEKTVYFIEGLAALDTPGEWFFLRTPPRGGVLYAWMPDGAKPGPDDVLRARVTDDMVIAGKNTRYVQVDGLRFFAGNLNAKGSHNVTIKNCEFLYPACSKRGMGVADSAFDVDFRDTEHFTFLNNVVRYSDGAVKGDKSRFLRVENNLFSHIDYAALGSMTLTIGGTGPQIRFNTLEYSGCSEGIKGQYAQYPDGASGPDSAGVEYNYLTKMGLIQWDGAALQNVDVTLRNNWVTRSRRMGTRNDQYNHIPIHLAVRNVLLGKQMALAADYHQSYHNTIIPHGRAQTFPCLQVHTGREGNRNTLVYNNAADSFDGEWPPVPIGNDGSHNWNSRKTTTDLRDELRDPDNLDFRPRHGSALIDAGRVIDKVLWPVERDDRLPMLEATKPFDVSITYNGHAPDLGAYEYGDRWYWIPGRVERKATHPVPPVDASMVKLDADLMWREAMGDMPVDAWISLKRRTPSAHSKLPDGETARIAYDVYFGRNRARLELRGRLENNIFTPGPLQPSTQYFWRVDVVARDGATERVVAQGDVWAFTTEDPTLHRVSIGAEGDGSGDYLLEVNTNRQVTLEFGLQEVPRVAEVVSARLRLHAGYRPIGGTLRLYQVSESGEQVCVDTLENPSAEWIDFDVTEAVAASGARVALVLTSTSKESGPGFCSTALQELRYDGLMVAPSLVVDYRLRFERIRIRPSDDAHVFQVNRPQPRLKGKASTRLMQDAWVTDGDTASHPTGATLSIGRNGGVQSRALFEFRVRDIVTSAVLKQARLVVALAEDAPVDPANLRLYRIACDWQGKFVHGMNFGTLSQRLIENVDAHQVGSQLVFDVCGEIDGNGRYAFALESRDESNVTIAGRYCKAKTPNEPRLEIEYEAPSAAWLHETVDDYRKTLRIGMPGNRLLGNVAAIRFVASSLPPGRIRRATIRLQAATDLSEIILFCLAHTDWVETPGAPTAITGEDLNRWIPSEQRVPLQTRRDIRKGDGVEFDVTAVVTAPGAYAFALASPDNGAAVFCREAHPIEGVGPELVLDVECSRRDGGEATRD
jgi:hypothetical protein